jgi:hypothetical protein
MPSLRRTKPNCWNASRKRKVSLLFERNNYSGQPRTISKSCKLWTMRCMFCTPFVAPYGVRDVEHRNCQPMKSGRLDQCCLRFHWALSHAGPARIFCSSASLPIHAHCREAAPTRRHIAFLAFGYNHRHAEREKRTLDGTLRAGSRRARPQETVRLVKEINRLLTEKRERLNTINPSPVVTRASRLLAVLSLLDQEMAAAACHLPAAAMHLVRPS